MKLKTNFITSIILMCHIKIILTDNIQTTIPRIPTCCKFQGQFVEDNCVKTYSENNPFSTSFTIPHQFILSHTRQYDLSELTLRLTQQPVTCSNGSLTLKLPFAPASYIDGENATEINEAKPVRFFPNNGFIKYGDDVYNLNEYCLNRVEDNFIEIVVCSEDDQQILVPKCCDVDEVWDVSRYPAKFLRCSPAGDNLWSPKIFSNVWSRNADTSSSNLQPHLTTTHPRSMCTEGAQFFTLKSFSDKNKHLFKILEDGSVKLKVDRKHWIELVPGKFCIDGGKNFPDLGTSEANTNVTSSSYSGNYEDTILVHCTSSDEERFDFCDRRDSSDLYGISLAVVSIFLLLTVIVYILLWEKQNIHGWTSLCCFASLFFMYNCTALVRFASELFYASGDGQINWGCYALALTTHFFWLSSFCWMSVVNFDLWWTFRALMPTGSKSKGVKRFLCYVTFSVGIPLIIVSTAVTLDIIYADDLESEIITPQYAKTRCYMEEQFAPLPYVHAPIAILLSCNLLFFTVTVYDMYKLQQSTKFAAMSSSKSSRQKQSIILFAKLFLLMGIPWASEGISWTVASCDGVGWYWKIFDMINILQGLAIFLTFACKSETRKALEYKYPAFQRFLSFVTLSPDKAQVIVDRHPVLKVVIKPFTRTSGGKEKFSSGKTLSTVTDAPSRISTRGKSADRTTV